MFAGGVPVLREAWGMNAAEAGSVQSTFNLAYAVSLVVTSWLSDRWGARQVFLGSTLLTALTGLALALFARSYESALLLFGLFGLCHGGSYTPAIMLVAQGAPAERRGGAIGLVLAAASIGYAGSIAISSSLAASLGYHTAFALCAGATALAAATGWLACRGRPRHAPGTRGAGAVGRIRGDRRQSVCITLGYTAHCWELLGMWAWMPAFLLGAFAAASDGGIGAAGGLWIGVALHLSGCVASLVTGRASDRYGRRAVLIALAAAGALCSFAAGWLSASPAALLLAFTALYGFAALGDSPVLSAAIADAVPARSLGFALAVRSILGFGAGGLAPLAFGAVRDALPGAEGWIVAFSLLGVGGLLATLFALLLPRARRRTTGGSPP